MKNGVVEVVLERDTASRQGGCLINEFKTKVSQFEKDSINSDIATLKLNWDKTKRNNVSQFEKDLIKKDINIISAFIKKVIDRFKG